MSSNFGLNYQRELEERSKSDWPLGATGLSCMAEIPPEEREGYLPKGELQRGREDFMSCVSIGALNLLAMKFNYLVDKKKLSFENLVWLAQKDYLKDGKVDFSDRFIAILSQTTREGNSLKAPLDAIRHYGLIPKTLLPAESWMTFDDYHKKESITPEMTVLGEEFKSRFFINYERGTETSFSDILERDMILSGGFAWPKPEKGIYPRTDQIPNHAFLVWLLKYFIMDNYEETKNDWIKQLAPDYDLLDGYRILINKESVTPQKKSVLAKIIEWLKDYINEILK